MSVVIDGTTGITVPAGASQAQAETGTDNTVLMTPLRTAQAISALSTAPALEFISSATINNVATVDFTGFDSSKYSDYVFSLNNVIPVTDNVSFSLRMSVDGGSTFLSSYGQNYIQASQTAVSSSGTTSGNSQIPIALNVGSDTNEFGVSGEVRVFGPDLTARTAMTSFLRLTHATSGENYIFTAVGQNEVTTAVNAVRFSFSSGNLESGRITMYGVRKS